MVRRRPYQRWLPAGLKRLTRAHGGIQAVREIVVSRLHAYL